MEMTAYCGLSCSACPAYIATVNNDNFLRAKTAEKWRKTFNPEIKTEDINCFGCKSNVLFGHCKTCGIRACGSEKQLENCAGCDTYSCDMLEGFFKHAPEAKKRLDGLRK